MPKSATSETCRRDRKGCMPSDWLRGLREMRISINGKDLRNCDVDLQLCRMISKKRRKERRRLKEIKRSVGFSTRSTSFILGILEETSAGSFRYLAPVLRSEMEWAWRWYSILGGSSWILISPIYCTVTVKLNA